MNQVLTIAKREITSLFYSPIAYVILGLFALVSSFIFVMSTFYPGQPASMRSTLFWIVYLMCVILPAISMRLLSEEFRTGTIEMLMTAPVSDSELIVGKWLGSLAFFVVLLVPVGIQICVLEIYGHPDYGPILTGLLGLLLLGGLFLAIGMFASALTQNQVIAFLIALAINLTFSIVTFVIGHAEWLSNKWRPVFYYLSLGDHIEDFAKGIIDLSHLVFFTTLTGLFLFFAMLTLQSRRWR